jgi:hypothetical protein
MSYIQMEFQARERQEELLREARGRRLAREVRSARGEGDLPRRLGLRRLVRLLWREPEYEASFANVEEDREATTCSARCGGTAGVA